MFKYSKRKLKLKSCYFLLALILGVYTYQLVPPYSYDLYRHFLHFNSLIGTNFSQVFEGARTGYVGLDVYAWVILKLGLSKHFIPASFIFIAYSLTFSVYENLRQIYLKEKSIIWQFIYFCIVFLSINYIFIASGLRSGLGATIIFFATVRLFEFKQWKIFVALSCIAVLLHPFPAVAILLVFLSYHFKRFSYCSWVLFLAASIFLAFPYLFYFIADLFKPALVYFDVYKTGYFLANTKWGGNYDATRNTHGLIGDFLYYDLSIIVALIYCIYVRSRKIRADYLLVSLVILFLAFAHPVQTLYTRMVAYFWYFFAYFAIKDISLHSNKEKHWIVLIYLGTIIISVVYSMYNYRAFIFS